MKKWLILIFILSNACGFDRMDDCGEDQILRLEEKLKESVNSDSVAQAELILKKLIKCNSKLKERYIERANLNWSSGKLKLAISFMDSALFFGYDLSLVYFNRALLYSELNDSKALDDLNRLRNLNPQDTLSIHLLGFQVFMNLKDYRTSLDYSDSLIMRMGDLSSIYQGRAFNRLQLGDTIGYCKEIKIGIEYGLDESLDMTRAELLAPCKIY